MFGFKLVAELSANEHEDQVQSLTVQACLRQCDRGRQTSVRQRASDLCAYDVAHMRASISRKEGPIETLGGKEGSMGRVREQAEAFVSSLVLLEILAKTYRVRGQAQALVLPHDKGKLPRLVLLCKLSDEGVVVPVG